MTEKRTKLKPVRKASKDLRGYARRAKEIREKFKAEGRHFGDSTEIVRADRDSRA